MNKHSASAQGQGYIHQLVYSTLLILLKSKDKTKVICEGLDDIEIRNDKTTLVQVKHSTKNINLTDYDSDFWKTINIWIEPSCQGADEYILLTTKNLKEGSLPFLLKGGKYDKFIEKIKKDGKKMSKNLLAFGNIEKTIIFLKKITIFNSQSKIGDVDVDIKKFITIADIKKRDNAYNDLIGFFMELLIEHLDKKREYIEKKTIILKIQALVSKYGNSINPSEFSIYPPKEIEIEVLRKNIFVEQLKKIQLEDEDIGFAITNYIRASLERACWVKNGKIQFEDLKNYDNQIYENWASNKIINKNKELYVNTIKLQPLSINNQIPDLSIYKGSCEILSDYPLIYWNESFKPKCEQVKNYFEDLRKFYSNNRELKRYFDKSFIAGIIYHFLKGYGEDVDISRIYLFIPLLLKKEWYDKLPGTTGKTLKKWMQENQEIRLLLEKSINNYKILVSRGILYGVGLGLFGFDKKSWELIMIKSNKEVLIDQEMLKKTEFLGRWMNKTNNVNFILEFVK